MFAHSLKRERRVIRFRHCEKLVRSDYEFIFWKSVIKIDGSVMWLLFIEFE